MGGFGLALLHPEGGVAQVERQGGGACTMKVDPLFMTVIRGGLHWRSCTQRGASLNWSVRAGGPAQRKVSPFYE